MKQPPFIQRALADLRLTISELRDPQLALWGLYIVLFPVYVWESGVPQPGDILVIIMAPVVLMQRRTKLPQSHRVVMRSLYTFTGWVIAVNVVWTIVLGAWSTSGKRGFIMSPLFYIYNVLVFLVFLVLYQRYGKRLLHLTAKLILYTLVLQVFAVNLLVRGGDRQAGMFNSPNQLGYFALLSVSMLIILQRRKYTNTAEVVIGSLAATYLALLSASKAALGGIMILAVAASVARFRTMMVVGLLLAPLLIIPNPMLDALERAQNRIENDESFDFLEERGYDRVFQHPEYWVLGSGEGDYKRFDDGAKIGSHEIHSSIGTLFFCYGIVGVMFFASFVFQSLRRTGLRTWLLFLPSLAYGMTHQGLRFTFLWVLLALIVVLRSEERAEAAAIAAQRATAFKASRIARSAA